MIQGNGNDKNKAGHGGSVNGDRGSSKETTYLPKDKQSLLAEGLALASTIASKSPVAVQGTKELLNVGRDKGVEESELHINANAISFVLQCLSAFTRYGKTRASIVSLLTLRVCRFNVTAHSILRHQLMVSAGLKYTAVWNSAMLQTDDVTRSIQAFMTGKKPTYENL